MKTLHVCLITALLLGSIQSHAGQKENEPFDFQLRIPFHLTYTDLYTNNLGSFGLATWTIFSDVTAKDNESATLHVFGPLWQYNKKKGSWVEIMGGFKRNENGYNDPVIDVRILDKSIPKINLTGEIAYFPGELQRRFYAFLAVDTPISFDKYQFRIGFESENIVSYSGGEDSLGIGPRFVFPIPLIKKISPSLSSSVTFTYQHRTDQDFLRCYMGISYSFGRK